MHINLKRSVSFTETNSRLLPVFVIMKQFCFSSIILSALCFLFLYPSESLRTAKDGLSMWLNTLLPVLLPFMILTGILSGCTFPFHIPKTFQKLSEMILGVSPSGLFVLILGLLCGYPMGARIASDFYIHEKISKREAHYLLTISCNASPVFLMNFLSIHILKNKFTRNQILLPLLAADLFCMLFFRFLIFHGCTISESKEIGKVYSHNRHKKETPIQSSFGALIDVSIMNGFETITRLGGYILLFSIISAMIRKIWPFTEYSLIFIIGFTELTTGLNQLALSAYPLPIQYLFSMILTASGGLCILMQIRSVLHKDLSLLPYVSAKILQCMILLILLSVV